MAVPFQARCAGDCGRDLTVRQIVVRRQTVNGIEHVDLVHRRRRGPDRKMGDCGPVIVVGTNEGTIVIEREPTALDRRRIMAGRARRRVETLVRAMPPRAFGAPPWEFGGEGCDFYGVLHQVEQALVERALLMTNHNVRAAARLLRIRRTTLYDIRRRFQYGGTRRHRRRTAHGDAARRVTKGAA